MHVTEFEQGNGETCFDDNQLIDTRSISAGCIADVHRHENLKIEYACFDGIFQLKHGKRNIIITYSALDCFFFLRTML
jgi:hypothetical protein